MTTRGEQEAEDIIRQAWPEPRAPITLDDKATERLLRSVFPTAMGPDPECLHPCLHGSIYGGPTCCRCGQEIA